MREKKNRTAVMAVFMYALLTVGSWMFVDSYVNSYNKLTADRIAPASVSVSGSGVRVGLLEHSAELDLSGLSPESRLYCAAYILAPDELRSACYLISLEYGV